MCCYSVSIVILTLIIVFNDIEIDGTIDIDNSVE